jgi:prevent-host-death family protein
MTEYSVAEAKNRLPKLINQAMEGEEVVITRRGKPVAELRPLRKPSAARSGTDEWLRARRHPPVGITSVELLNLIYEEEEH